MIKTSRDQTISHTLTKYYIKKLCENTNDPVMQKTLHYEQIHNLDNKQRKSKRTFIV